MQASAASSHYRADIDGLRAIAVLCVVLFHMFPEWMNGGFVGVDVFFVISGLLITGIILSDLEKDTFSFAAFYARRIKRIFPALIIVLSSSFALGWWCVLLPADLKQLGWHMAAGAGFASNFVLWRETGYFDSAAETKPLLHLWSLGIEEQFYVFWPMLLWLIHRLRLAFLFMTLAIIAASFASTMAGDAAGVFYSPLTRCWELSLGSILAFLTMHRPLATEPRSHAARWPRCLSPRGKGDDKLAASQSGSGLLLIVLAVVLIDRNMRFPGWWTLLPTLGAYCILSAGPQAELNRVLASPGLVGIGRISYPLYLWHWPLLAFARIMDGALPRVGTRLCMVLASFVLAWLTYRFVERPIRFGKHGKAKVAMLCVLMILTGLGGLYTYENDGFDFRIPQVIVELTQPKINVNAWRTGKCFINKGDPNPFAGECIERNKRPLVFLWGDSHAAALYAGLKDA
jgi:peptidoglycan/LPS O-acetylase OafA/YrhL